MNQAQQNIKTGKSLAVVAAILATACGGGSPAGPVNTPSAAPLLITATASPNPITGILCNGCGVGSTEREMSTTVTVTETGGGSGTIQSLSVLLRDNASAVGANVEFDAAFITQSAGGSNRLTAMGRLAFQARVHYSPDFLGRSGTVTLTVRALDSRGASVTSQIVVPVNPM